VTKLKSERLPAF